MEPKHVIIELTSRPVVQRKKGRVPMATLEERVQALEQEHTELKKTIELQNIAIGALVSKATLEKLNEKYDKLFETLIAHDNFTNTQLSELRNQHIELDGKITGLQTEMRQRFTEQDGKIVGLQTEMRQRFTEQDSKIMGLDNKVTGLDNKVTGLDNKVTGLDNKVTGLDNKVTGLDNKVTGLDNKVAELQMTQAEHTSLLQQILARLPAKP